MSSFSTIATLLLVAHPISAQWACSDGQPARGYCVQSSCAQSGTFCENKLCCGAPGDNYRMPGAVPASQNTVRQQQPVYIYNAHTQQWQQQQQQQQQWRSNSYAQQVAYPQTVQSACAGATQPMCACNSQANPSCPVPGYYCQRANPQELNLYQRTNQVQPDGVCCPSAASMQAPNQYYGVNQARYQQPNIPTMNVYPSAQTNHNSVYSNSYAGQISTQTAKFPVLMYTLSNCVYCKNAKTLLATVYSDLKPMSVDVDNTPAMEAQMTIDLQKMTGTNMFPMIFVCGNYIGGFDRLSVLHRGGQFRAMARKCL